MKNYNWELVDDGTLDTVIEITIYNKRGKAHKTDVRLTEVDRYEDGSITDEGWEQIKEAVIEEVEYCSQAWNEDAQDARNGI